MKASLNKVNNITKVVIGFSIFVVIVTIIGRLNYQPPQETAEDNSELINRITDRNPSPLSFPASYSQEWIGQITLVPKKSLEFGLEYSNSDQCKGITSNMAVYFTPGLAELMIINNINLLSTEIEFKNFNDAIQIIKGEKDFINQNAELEAFRTYCPYFSLYPVENFDVEYVGTEYAKAVFGIGLRQGTIEPINQLSNYVYVYAIKEDNIILLSKTLAGDFIFSQSDWDSCKDKSLQTTQNECLKQIYLSDASMKSKIKSEVNNLINTFELP
ncbi:hypothetical protein IH575_01555 [Candidatus Dojkabacteria bacterium]|nr:hypothetical protein [Candidatus Dojkabacteria bacterium]